ncbi:MAG: dihydroneopterin aldolase, partial [Bdellovibrionales bacterium]|nr:dihydroneopterin aldolase [Bdellovibrionales bacterium]
ISLELKVDVFNAARYDSIADTLDYVELVELIRSISEAKTFRLAEAYGMYLLEAILTKWEIVTAGSISVVKSIFPGMKGFEVEIELQRGDLN